MNEQLATLFERLAGKDSAQRFLRRLGLDPQQFVLFLGLLRTLSEREEYMNIAGVDRFILAYVAIYEGVMAIFLWLMLVASGIPAPLYLLINLFIALALIFPTIIREAASSLFNPVEASMLAHVPVHSLTYAAAKIAHLAITILYTITALVLPAALLGVVLKGAHWYWPFTHFASAVLLGLSLAFLVCALYGLLLRIVPIQWLKGLSMWIQLLSLVTLPYLLISFPSFLPKLLMAKSHTILWNWLPLAWIVQIGLLGCRGASWQIGWQALASLAATLLFIWFGLRSFSGTYFAESSSSIQASSRRDRASTVFSRTYAGLIRIITGSSLGLGACSFICKMMRRDWQFRRNLLTQTLCLPFLALLVLIMVRSNSMPSPLAQGKFSSAHFLPHLLGLIALSLCTVIPFTDFHRGSWIYLAAPMDNLRAYARGVYFSLWLPAAGIPHLVLLPFMIRLWGLKDAVLFDGFSLIVVSMYLSFEIRAISGIPFSSPFIESLTRTGAQAQVCWIMAIIFAVTLQSALFHLWWAVVIVAILLVFATWSILHFSLGELEEEMRWRLHIMKMGRNQMFKEVE